MHCSLADVDGCTVLTCASRQSGVRPLLPVPPPSLGWKTESSHVRSTSPHTRKTAPGHTEDEMPAATNASRAAGRDAWSVSSSVAPEPPSPLVPLEPFPSRFLSRLA
ncbi:hypothetical protein MSAN_01583000 [Mycena sanguinolenta]|uniref:Uncharacterized protein n=1 Tax=Mycena sanguinolenta TaxID=230812 RepID=A0A8H7CX82_9AGAR|nr:hypothetical protein MSAN_01583000 [Mycena sanguinolenta]